MRTAALFLIALAIVATTGACASPRVMRAIEPAQTVEITSVATLDAGVETAPKPDVRTVTFKSLALGRAMPYSISLPPGYAPSKRVYPVLYMLHGMSGTNDEWREYGIFDAADRMIRSGEIRPLIIVLPQGDKAYWVDHALPTDQEAWGRYMAKDVVADVDARYRTVADLAHRAIGGVSMGAHGAVQLALNYPDTFSIVGAHSLVLLPSPRGLSPLLRHRFRARERRWVRWGGAPLLARRERVRIEREVVADVRAPVRGRVISSVFVPLVRDAK